MTYYDNNREQMKAYSRDYYWTHRSQYLTKDKEYREKLKLEALTHYGGNPPQCSCCGETILQFLSVEHLHGGGKKHRQSLRGYGNGSAFYLWLRKNNFPPDYGVLCMNCNFAKGHFGVCPHQLMATHKEVFNLF